VISSINSPFMRQTARPSSSGAPIPQVIPDLGPPSGLRSLDRSFVHGSYSVGPKEIVEILIETVGPVCARHLVEVSVHLPRRGSRWVASFRDETGRQVWRTTGLRDREPALVLARRWEGEAKRRQAAQPAAPTRLTIRVRPGSVEKGLGGFSQQEVAAIMRISRRTVREIERRALAKLRSHPALQDFWREWTTGQIKETALRVSKQWTLSRVEVAAVYALARTTVERQALRKLLALTQGAGPQHSSGSVD
jgi:hypothetical protein